MYYSEPNYVERYMKKKYVEEYMEYQLKEKMGLKPKPFVHWNKQAMDNFYSALWRGPHNATLEGE